jgi:hypothetical protein
MAIPGSGPISMGMMNEAVFRKDTTENSRLAGPTGSPTADVGSLFYLGGQLGTLNQNAPHAFSEWYNYSPNSTTTTTTSSTTTTTTFAVNCTLTGGSAIQLCNFAITEVQTTNPTNQQGNNGTATITYVNAESPVTSIVNGVTGATASTSSPLILSGLSANTTYNVTLIDNNDCTVTTSFKTGDSIFQFVADFMMLTYEFTNGRDLDTRTRIVTPNVGQNTQADYVGWAVKSQWPQPSPAPFEIWGGDNKGTGFESVLVNLKNFTAAYPGATGMVIDLRAFWFGAVGTNPVNVAATLWKGGNPIKNGCVALGVPYCWTNPTATSTFTIDSVGKVITQTGGSSSSGERVATLTYNLTTGAGLFNNNDTTTPSV